MQKNVTYFLNAALLKISLFADLNAALICVVLFYLNSKKCQILDKPRQTYI